MNRPGWFVDKFKYAKPPYHADGMAVYDATNPEARKYYWDQVNKALFRIGLDAWWMDTTEPETEGQEENIQLGHRLAAGSGDRYVNDFPLLDTGAAFSFFPARHLPARREIRSPRGRAISTPTGSAFAARFLLA